MCACKLLIKLILFKLKVPKRVPGTLFLRNLVERRSLLFQLVRRDFEQRFIGSAMGWIWGVIHPLVLLVSWWYVFSVCLKTPLPKGEVTQNYALYLFAGMLPWLLFSDTVQRSASSLLDQANLITKTVFPAEIVPVSVFLSALVSHLLALALLIAVAGVWENQISIFLLLLPAYMLALGLFAVGLGWIVASLHVFLRDTAQVLSVLLTLWFWMTPIMIAETYFPSWAKILKFANPMYYGVRAYRQILLTSRLPDPSDLLMLIAYGAATFLLGGLFFRYMKKGFADVL
jgi:homopolymeric O-antigen transport system permease protein